MQFELSLLEQVAVSPINAGFILGQAIGLLSFPIFLILLSILLPGIVQAYKKKWRLPKRLIGYSLAAISYPVAIAVIGGLFWDSGFTFIIYLLHAAVLCYLGFPIYLIAHERGWRTYVISIGAFCLVFSLMTLFITTMAVSGTWL